MSDQIPFHIQEEIMKLLPVKSLIQFRSVSKAWKSLIESSEFISAHNLRRHNQQQHLLISYQDEKHEEKFVDYIDDHTFPQQRSDPTLPLSVKQLIDPKIIGCSHGLLCMYGYHPNYSTKMVVLWNPSIRKSIVVQVPNEPYVGFGVCHVTNDPKILAITEYSEIMVYTFSSRKWRSLSINLPIEQTPELLYSVVTDRFIYSIDDLTRDMIMSFDLTSESFELINLPDNLACGDPWNIHISKLRDSLALLQCGEDYNFSTVWMMEHGVRVLFTKLYTITTPHNGMVGFTKNGILLMKPIDDDDVDVDESATLVVYELNSKDNNVLEICDVPYHFNVHSYMETLLLLGRSGYTGY